MKKNVVLVIQLLFSFATLFAKQNLDSVILLASGDITEQCNANSILVIDDFESASENMTVYIRDQLADSIFQQNGLLKIITREHMDKIEKELTYQNSGKVDEKTIVSVAERLGANSVVFGKFEELSNTYNLRIRMLDVKTGAYVFRKSYEISRSAKIEQLLGRAAVWRRVAIGISAEANKNSLEAIAPALGFSFDYGFTRKFSGGIKVFASYDVYEKDNDLIILEPLALLRFYLVSPSGEPETGMFLEGLGGISILLVNSDTNFVANGGGGLGYRLSFGNFYLEPEIRAGYPYLFGVGLSAGIRF